MLKTWSIRNFCLWLSLWSLWLSNCRQHYTVELFVLLVFTLLLHDVHSADDHPQWVGIFKNICQLGRRIALFIIIYSHIVARFFFEFSVSKKTPCSKIQNPKNLRHRFSSFPAYSVHNLKNIEMVMIRSKKATKFITSSKFYSN